MRIEKQFEEFFLIKMKSSRVENYSCCTSSFVLVEAKSIFVKCFIHLCRLIKSLLIGDLALGVFQLVEETEGFEYLKAFQIYAETCTKFRSSDEVKKATRQ